MRKCPRFDECSIPLCPLDYWMSERTELTEDTRCPMFKMLFGRKSSKMQGGILTPKMRHISRNVLLKTQSRAKTGYCKQV